MWYYSSSQPSNNDMSPKEFFEAFKAFQDYIKEQNKPKDDKKPPPGDWGPWDYLTFILFFHSIGIVVGTCIVLHYLIEYTKAIHP